MLFFCQTNSLKLKDIQFILYLEVGTKEYLTSLHDKLVKPEPVNADTRE